jgi:hypothetical protein
MHAADPRIAHPDVIVTDERAAYVFTGPGPEPKK